jgi:hypothetical protein
MIRLNPNFLDDVEKFSGKSLNKKNDLAVIIESYKSSKKFEDFKNLSFTGKYVNGLFRVLANSAKIPELENVDHIKRDLSDNMEKVITQLKEITSSMNDMDKKYFEENYIRLSQTTMQNLQQLVEGLDNIKKYLNFLKRK